MRLWASLVRVNILDSSCVRSHSMELRVIMPPLQSSLTGSKLDVATRMRRSHGSGQINFPGKNRAVHTQSAASSSPRWWHEDISALTPLNYEEYNFGRRKKEQGIDVLFFIRGIYSLTQSYLPPHTLFHPPIFLPLMPVVLISRNS